MHELKGTHVLVYLDDVIVATRSWSEHIETLGQVFQRFRSAGLKVKPSKCSFGQPGLRFLGHYIDSRGIQTDKSKTESVTKIPPPSGVRRFLGMAGYRRFVANFARIAQPLSELTRKDVVFDWGEAQQSVFDRLKEALTSGPILVHFCDRAKLQIKTDDSLIGLGAVLLQSETDGRHPVAYASRRTSRSEVNLSATELEGLGIVWAVEYFRAYILGKEVEIITDHTALCSLCSLGKKKPLPRKLARWALTLQEFNLKIIYSRGRTHHEADCLSRAAIDTPDDSDLERMLTCAAAMPFERIKPDDIED
ncbi:Retrovirus-related Pol polyprotein from transposon 17.6, partial [Fragariocoptes setiger]